MAEDQRGLRALPALAGRRRFGEAGRELEQVHELLQQLAAGATED